MSLSDLIKGGKARRLDADPQQIKSLLAIAERDLRVAEILLEKSPDASFMHSYNAILQCCRALMFWHGYRATEDEHKTAIAFAGETMPGFQQMPELDRMRRKRHIATYDEADTVSRHEAEHAADIAKSFYALVSKKVGEKRR